MRLAASLSIAVRVLSLLSCPLTLAIDDFEAVGNAGAFYILSALQNFHSYLAQYEENVESLRVQLYGDVLAIVKQFEFPNEKASDMKIGDILAGALGIASAATAPVSAVSGPLAITGALVPILAPKINAIAEPEVKDSDDTEIFIQRWINSTTNAMRDEIQVVRSAVFGGWGGNEFIDIPEGFKVSGHDV